MATLQSEAPWSGPLGIESGAPTALPVDLALPEGLRYRLKRRLLGRPLTREQLQSERLSKRLALGVLSSDCISSSAYGSEEMLLILLPAFGIAAYTLLLPMTVVILAVLFVVTLSYRSVVMVYTRAGGSYVVARENFGPAVAQIAAVALMLDYIVTVAVQAAAGTAAVTSAVPALASWNLELTVGVVLLLFYGNLRGVREAGRLFALPTYFFVVSMLVVIVLGIGRELTGNLPHYNVHVAGAFPVGSGHALFSAAALFVLLRSFANGGSSLTGLEAISNGVSVFRHPEGHNARRTLVVMSTILGTLVAGVSWLAHETHAVPYLSGTPTVISQVARAVLGTSLVGHVGFFVVQIATMLILYTGANTPFNGFPFLANFVAEDAFLPRWLTKRGHRLAFSNGIIVLTVVSIALLLGTGAHVDKLVAFYAIGVFTGFTLAGFGMARHFSRERAGNWRAKTALNAVAGAVSLLVVIVFAVTKFTEGAWLVLVLFPVMTFALIRLHREYREEASVLSAVAARATEPNYAEQIVVVLIDSVDLATLRAIRYARSLKPTDLRAAHFVVDTDHAKQVEAEWAAQPGLTLPLHLIDCPDRRLTRAALELAARLTNDQHVHLTMLLPRRTYGPLLGRLLHDRTADEIAEAVTRLPHVAATIVPFGVHLPEPRQGLNDFGAHGRRCPSTAEARQRTPDPPLSDPHRPQPSWQRPHRWAGGAVATVDGDGAACGVKGVGTTPGLDGARPAPKEAGAAGPRREGASVAGGRPISSVSWRKRTTIEGRVREVRLTPLSGVPTLAVELCDSTGGITLLFYGRRRIGGVEPGARVRVNGMVGEHHGHLAIANPTYELLPS